MIAAPIGEAEGIYKKHNLKVKLTGNGKVPEAMAAGKMDAGYIGARKQENVNYRSVIFNISADKAMEMKTHKIGRASCREKCRSRWSPYH